MMTAVLHYRSATRVPEFVKVQINFVEPILFEVRRRNAASLLAGRRPEELDFLEPDLTDLVLIGICAIVLPGADVFIQRYNQLNTAIILGIACSYGGIALDTGPSVYAILARRWRKPHHAGSSGRARRRRVPKGLRLDPLQDPFRALLGAHLRRPAEGLVGLPDLRDVDVRVRGSGGARSAIATRSGGAGRRRTLDRL